MRTVARFAPRLHALACVTVLACNTTAAPPVQVRGSASIPSSSAASRARGASSETRYVALGDSFTAGTGSAPAASFPARWVARWSCHASLTNLGVNGYTTDDVISEELPVLAQLASTGPVDLVTLAIGANDIVRGTSPEAYDRHVRQILAAVVAARVKRIVALPQPDWSLSPSSASFGAEAQLHASIVLFNGILQKETEAAGGRYVDLFPLMEDEARAHMVARDGLHPSAPAYDAWSDTLSKQLVALCPQ